MLVRIKNWSGRRCPSSPHPNPLPEGEGTIHNPLAVGEGTIYDPLAVGGGTAG